ncbi:Isochorismatase hydrolase [Aspergillus steynii IBT 23096]|uniref:Isochorismatase hydrolase n=1 Tax=Aspergillus steynii IBT 23096 TaxID=1392250 RepID=A0A2I2GM28_9EURO|nr:Isochorismatase hydrolase [Aspergillus steynii IBT 23096]PLB53941.1 Isochorismatase hydrolase [Aspergillus steynii IBT 23096]
MLFAPLMLGAVSLLPLAQCTHQGTKPIYLSNQVPIAPKSVPNFGSNYAVLNLDLIDAIVANVNTTDEGKKWIENTATWIDAVHDQNPPPLNIFTRIYFSTSQLPEVGPDTPFASVAKGLGNLTESSAKSQIYKAFKTEDEDVVVPKTRYYAGAGNSIEEILNSQGVDTVVLSGIRTSGVILATALRLFDLDYNVYVISNNTIEPDPSGDKIQNSILYDIFPKIPVKVITLEEALEGLKASR